LEVCSNLKKLDLNLDELWKSCLGQCTSLLELELNLCGCEGLLDVAPLSSLEACINLKKLDLNLGELKAGALKKGINMGPVRPL